MSLPLTIMMRRKGLTLRIISSRRIQKNISPVMIPSKSMTNPWPDLRWWDSGERQVVEEKIDELEASGHVCNPKKDLLYAALGSVREEDCRVCIVGQDPYPNPAFATGIAFSIPRGIPEESYPGTLRLFLDEYVADTKNTFPSNGDLSRWTSQGVLLWNAIPSVQSGAPLSNDWSEWDNLTSEIIGRLSARGVVFALLGAVARDRAGQIDEGRNRVIRTGHPSRRGNINSKIPFTGSRLFSTINAKLREINREPVDWCLDASKPVITPAKNVLPNIGNISFGGLMVRRLPKYAESTFSLE